MNIYFLNTLQSGFDLFQILKEQIPIKGYLGLSENVKQELISGYFNARSSFKMKASVNYFELTSYGINNERDRQLIESLDIDVLIVGGWQRLIPDFLIQRVSKAAIGIHGSPEGITKGRGRSPQNWALIYGCERFEFSIFKIDKGVDSGEVIASASFVYHPGDDIRTSYIKSTYISSRLIADSIKNGLLDTKLKEQESEKAFYYPQRTADDGLIDWKRSAVQIYNFVRALTRPYPGAYDLTDGEKLTIWKAVPFDNPVFENDRPGRIIECLAAGEIIIACGQGAIIVTDYHYSGTVAQLPGKILKGGDFTRQIEALRQRHYDKYPDLEISHLISR